jgi:hypothetical protein
METVGRADASKVKRVDEVVQRLEGLVAEGLHGREVCNDDESQDVSHMGSGLVRPRSTPTHHCSNRAPNRGHRPSTETSRSP